MKIRTGNRDSTLVGLGASQSLKTLPTRTTATLTKVLSSTLCSRLCRHLHHGLALRASMCAKRAAGFTVAEHGKPVHAVSVCFVTDL